MEYALSDGMTTAFLLECCGGEISGLRSWTAFVVIRGTFPNFDVKPNSVPNNDALTKFKQKNYLLRKTFFLTFSVRETSKALAGNCVERAEFYRNPKAHEKSMLS